MIQAFRLYYDSRKYVYKEEYSKSLFCKFDYFSYKITKIFDKKNSN